MVKKYRTEQEVFADLESLCKEDGFIYAYSILCTRDNFMIKKLGDESLDSIQKWYSPERLIRNELNTLQGLMIKRKQELDPIDTDRIMIQVARADSLLKEIHDSMTFHPENMKLMVDSWGRGESFSDSLLQNPNMLRETIFYSSESAYDFQYKEFAKLKFFHDKEWLSRNKGFDAEEAVLIVDSLIEITKYNIENLHSKKMCPSSMLDIYKIDIDALASKTNLSNEKISSFINTMTSIKENVNFKCISDMNESKITPIVKIGSNYYLFHHYTLLEAIYESPMFWIRDEDKKYLKTAEKNRGTYTEDLTKSILIKIFGEDNVYSNIDIFDEKKSKTKIGEIDLLVIFGGKALIFQAKSKALTLQARRGNIDILKSDFFKGIQKAYNQAVECSVALHKGAVILKDENGNKIDLKTRLTRFYPITITSEYYPAITFQSNQFLKRTSDYSYINEPFVMDVFFLDILSEFLDSPLYFISYIDRRSNYFDTFIASSEYPILSHHLKTNLWLDGEYSVGFLDESLAADLDDAILARRSDWQGKKTPTGILTKYQNTFFEKIIKAIETKDYEKSVDFGLSLLKLSEKAINDFNLSIKTLVNRTKQDNKTHDFSLFFEKFGLTCHVANITNKAEFEEASIRLQYHIDVKKYIKKSKFWYGILINASNNEAILISMMDFEWKKDLEFEKNIPQELAENKQSINIKDFRKEINKKIGRNDPCICGSGKKYKKCCI